MIIPNDSWVPVTPGITSDLTNRHPILYTQCCKQFGVETSPRYARGHMGHNETYCNIYLWDCSVALGAEIPHWIDPATGAPVAMGKGKETDANAVCDWLAQYGPVYGWQPAGMVAAVANAVDGNPTVMTYKNPSGDGHVAVVLPTPVGSSVLIAQAGATNFFNQDYHKGFANLPVLYYIHA